MNFDDVNSLAKQKIPFLFISDFKAGNIKVIPLSELKDNDIEFCINENYKKTSYKNDFYKFPLAFSEYKKKFDCVIDKIKSGDTYLLNLTQATPIKTKLSLKKIYKNANAAYKLRYKNEFICFSPEKFIQIKDSTIHSYPMKGTIDASIKNAKEKILNNKKEIAEHIMIVDLLRNDLSIVAKKVRVQDFRYIKTIEAGDKKLLQVSSHIIGDLSNNWQSRLGDILKALLPAGSISGTPKKSTLDIIQKVENYDRGFFTGVFGVFDGFSFDSAVMIRYIEQKDNKLIYKSGGGITLDSDCLEEYNELLDKIYLP
ncbi:MAG: aminodeoxychorismate synthase component I [Sulfurimonas sp.]|nr:MAG: aminodeoxychorismate synthase component I [Sulfurimonas sp.]